MKYFILLALCMTTAAFAAEKKRSTAASDTREVSHLIKCHEGKFDAMNAVSQLTADISQDVVYGHSGIGAYPDGHVEGEMVSIKAPFNVSAPTFVKVGDVTWACVSVSKARR